MFFRILMKDMKHKRGINVILILFMLLATVFVASSVNNIMVISNAMNYCMDKGKVADTYISAYEAPGEETIEDWLKNNEIIKSYSKNEAVILAPANIDSFNDKEGKDYDIKGTIMLMPQWHDNMMIFDLDGNEVKMNKGEIAMQQKELDRNGLKIGDEITFKVKDETKTFRIAEAVMDPAFGGDFVGMTRYVINDEDFEDVKATGMTVNYNYNINTDDKEAFTKALNRKAFNIITTVDKEMFSFAYVMPLVTAGILIIVGVCLIVIAFLILRFTIVFTLQEDYKEIGIMKAIGIKNFMIKKIYLMKYFVLVVIAAIAGCFLSIPMSNIMMDSVRKTMMMEKASGNFAVNVLCSVVVAALVLVICYLCTNRLKKFSAIEAIRSGQTGERFHRSSKLALHKSGRIRTAMFMAINDILSNIKRYVVLLLTFTIGMVIIILPMNAFTSLGSKEMGKNFMLNLDADFYIASDISDDENNDAASCLSRESMVKNMENVQQELKNKGYDADISSLIYYSFSYYAEDKDNVVQEMTLTPIGDDGSYFDLVDGTFPVNENEIAMSEKAMKKIGVNIGDTVHVMIGKEDRTMLITASYQNYMQMGQSVLLSSKTEVGDVRTSGCWLYQCKLKNQKFTNDTLDNIRKDFPDYTFENLTEAMNSQLGSTGDQIASVKMMVLILICGVNILITVLMMKIFIMSEKSQIAMLRSIGYSLKTIRAWQVMRIGIILILSAILGSLLSLPLNVIALKPIFAMMGATHMKIQVNALEVYLFYPFVLLVMISLAAYISAGSIKKMNLMEINNQE